MRTRILTLFMIGLLFSSTSFATIRRVGYTDVRKPVSGVDYTSFYLAHAAASNGDTIYVFPGKTLAQNGWPTAYGRAEITKRLVIVGKGSWLDSSSNPKGNADYQANKGVAKFGNPRGDVFGGIFFYPSSAGSVIMGFEGDYGYIWVGCDSLLIKSNFNLVVFLSNDHNIKNLTVEKNYRVAFSGDNSNDIIYSDVAIRNNFLYQLSLPQHSYNGTINNNVLAHDYYGTENGGDMVMSYVNGNSNYFYESYINLQEGAWLFSNNLIVFNQANAPFETPFVITGGNSAFFNYNVAVQSTNFTTWPGTAVGNVFLPTSQVESIFEGFPAIKARSADNRYMLKANSPAKAGSASRPASTVDAGMFGGTTPYKLSTIPSIPTIYKISSPQGNNPTGNTIEIKLSTRSNN